MVVLEEHRGKLLKLDKGHYGTKQGGCCGWKHFVQVMEGIGFSVSFYDDSFYHLNCGSDTILVWIHVDNGIVTPSSESVMCFFQRALNCGHQSRASIFFKNGVVPTFPDTKDP
ncbi:uncharacterized protein VP01_3230g1 [Puccinia sorghi]|uniref:Reverse transcriptase Ty1/copia-type domain-containing protein n=1 Tax=Puccinia sorghi TaxID=27349 RepID=A0A0L6UZ15_9BASI|nr:uncharacterized protein VP01_3230g1 [Puccinia sorghi]